MTTPQTEKIRLTELSTEAFVAFCDGIAGMFGIEMTSRLQPDRYETLKELEQHFKKLTAVITVKAEGILTGELYFVFAKEAVFTLAGTIGMQPEQQIKKIRKNGTLKDAEELHDAVAETGRLLVASWDSIFRENLEGHVRYFPTETFIGNPWSPSQTPISLIAEEGFFFLPYEIKVGSLDGVSCGVIFPKAVFNHADKTAAITSTGAVTSGSEENTPVSADEFQAEDSAGGPVSQTIQKMVQSLPPLPAGYTEALLGLSAEQIMRRDILWGNPEDSVQVAMETMQQSGAACMMVGVDAVLQGIVTWIDVAEAVSIYLRPMLAKWRRPLDNATLQIKIKVIMRQPVRTIKPETSMSVIMEEMCQHHLRCLPVVNTQGKVEGVVTPFDIFRVLLNNPEEYSVIDKTPQPTSTQ